MLIQVLIIVQKLKSVKSVILTYNIKIWLHSIVENNKLFAYAIIMSIYL